MDKNTQILAGIAVLLVAVFAIALVQMKPVNAPQAPELQLPAATKQVAVQTQEAQIAEQKATIIIDNKQFAPEEITIAPGTTVTWINKDYFGDSTDRATIHVLKEQLGLFRSERLAANEQFSYTFTEKGTYTYIDAIFPTFMKGKVVVEEPSLQALTGSAVFEQASTQNSTKALFAIILLGVIAGLVVSIPSRKSQLMLV